MLVVSISTPLDDMAIDANTRWGAFLRGLKSQGFVDAENVIVERITGRGRETEFDTIAYELVERRPHVIYVGGTRIVRGLQRAGATMPIVGITADPLIAGIVDNINQPEANVTGFSIDPGADFYGKHLQFFRDVLPSATRLAYVAAENFITGDHPAVNSVRALAPKLEFSLTELPLRSPVNEAEYKRAFGTMRSESVDGAYFGAGGENREYAESIARMALDARLPVTGTQTPIAHFGGLMAYGVDIEDLHLRASGYVARLLRGEPVRDLPYQQPEKFDFVINLRTARALGIEIPPKLLIQATELIE